MEQIDEAIKKINIYLELKTAKLPLLEKAYIILSHPLHAMGLAYEQNEPILSK